MRYQFMNLFFSVAMALGVFAVDVAETVSSDLSETVPYSTLTEAVAAIPENGSVRLLQNVEIAETLTIPRSCLFDLNGHVLNVKSGVNALSAAADAVVTISGGRLSGGSSMIVTGKNAVFNVTNCTIDTYCLYYPAYRGEVHFWADVHAKSTFFMSQWGDRQARFYTHEGCYCLFDTWNDLPCLVPVASQHILQGGWFSKNTGNIVADGYMTLGGRMTETSPLGNLSYFYHVVPVTEENLARASTAEADIQDVPFPLLADALTVAGNGDVVHLRKDMVTQTRLTVPRSPSMTNTLDLGGHILSCGTDGLFSIQGGFVMTNGTVSVNEGSAVTIIWMNVAGGRFRSDSSVTFAQGSSDYNLAFVFGASNTRTVVDGSRIEILLYSSWSSSYTDLSFVATNDVVFTGMKIAYSDTRPAGIQLCGGCWSQDPSTYLGAGCAIYRTSMDVSVPYFITPFAQQTYALSDAEPRLFVGSVPSDVTQVMVGIEGEWPRERRLLADFSQMSGYQDLSFAFAGGVVPAKNAELSYMGGKLYAQTSGLLFVVR